MPLSDIPDDELLKRAISGRRRRYRGVQLPLWSVVADLFSLGSTYAFEMCARCGFDPEEKVGSRITSRSI